MADYPDWTGLAQIVGTDVKVAVDIQGGYIMLPVDIQAANITIDIDIVAQTVGNILVDIKAQSVGNIAVNIAASAVTLNMNLQSSAITLNVRIASQAANINVDIKASSVTLTVTVSGTANIDITAQSVAVYNAPDWASKEGDDFILRLDPVSKDKNAEGEASWQIPAGKTAYAYGASVFGYVSNTANRNEHILIGGEIRRTVGVSTTVRAYFGGNGGGAVSMETPIVIEAGDDIKLAVINRSGQDGVYVMGTLWGWYA